MHIRRAAENLSANTSETTIYFTFGQQTLRWAGHSCEGREVKKQREIMKDRKEDNIWKKDDRIKINIEEVNIERQGN
jgi:hypothetical protein